MFIKDWKKEIFTIPNLLSLFRLLLIPVYITIYLNAKNAADFYIAAGILAVSCITDLIDGKIARHFGMISNLGKILDPLADKATQFALILSIAHNHPVLWYLVALFVIKEGFQLIAGGISLHHGRMLKGALFSGKLCTTVLFISLIIMVMLPQLPKSVIVLLTVIDTLFMFNAFIGYLITYFKPDGFFQNIKDDSECL